MSLKTVENDGDDGMDGINKEHIISLTKGVLRPRLILEY